MNYFVAFIIAVVAVVCMLIVKGGNRFDYYGDTDEHKDIKDNEP